jgi:pSer/pThr/pTyr-binding forkhead associated (FHA) protein
VFKLTIEDDEGKTTVIPLIRDEMTIGRQDGNTIRLTERNISRKHARLLRQNGTLYVEDLASYTGVRVNGARIVAVTPVAEGDEVQIGDYKLMLRIDRPAAAFNPDRATMPAMPAVLGGPVAPMGTVGGSVAIPTRRTPPRSGQAQTPPAPPAPASPMAVQAAINMAAAPPVVRQSAPVPHMTSAVPDPLEAQPTIPVRTLGDDQLSAGLVAARIVIVTSELAGQEFSLARASVVIGRTEENDVVVNHRSISRHHAKIVREGDRYTIVDLQSANGVRVNGEDYERIDLHPGDVVELGHVKLRFVGPNEQYVFDPAAARAGRRLPGAMVLGGGALAVCAIVAVVVFAMRGPRSPEAGPVASAATPEPAVTAPAVPVGPTPQSLLDDATRAAGAEDWATARAALDKLGGPGRDPNAPSVTRQALELGRRVDAERQAAALYGQFSEATAAKSYADALARYGQIPAASVYKAKGRARADEVRSLLIAERLAEAEKARAAGRCAEVRQAANELAELDPHNQLPQELVHLCRNKPEPRPARTRVAAATPKAERLVADRPDERKAERQSAAAAEPASAPDADADADALMKQARDAWLRQQCGSAMDLSRKAIKVKPGLADAYQIIAVCSCSLKDAEGATRAYAKLDDKNRNLVRSLCQKNGIIVGGEAP